MPLSFVQYTADGVTDTFNIPFPYISTSHLQIKVNGILNSGVTFPTSSTVKTSSIPINGAVVEVRRITPNTTRLVDFADGSLLGESDLDLSALQAFYISQEVTDDLANRLGVDSTNKYDAGNRIIRNLAPGILDTDAANVGQLLPFAASAAASAALSAASAASSAASALDAENSATDAQSAALLAEDWANKTTGTVNGFEYSAKKYAQDAANAAASVPANPMTARYDMIVGGLGPAYPFTRLPGPTFAATLFLQATGNGTACTGVQWGSLYPEHISASGTGLAINKGGTGGTTAQEARNNLLPTQTGNPNKALVTNGTNASWGTLSCPISRRNTVLSGTVDNNGKAAFLGTGSGLQPQLLASASNPLVITAANGFTSDGKPDDRFFSFTANQSFSACTPGCTNYLYADIDTAGTVTLGSTQYPWGDGEKWTDIEATQKILSNCEVAPLVDQYGNANGDTYWIRTGSATVSASAAKYGTNGMDCAASGKYFQLDMQQASGIPSLATKDRWGIGFWFQRKSSAGGNGYTLAYPYNASFNIIGIGTGPNFTPNPHYHLYLQTTGSLDITGTNNLAVAFPLDTWVWVAINFDKFKATQNYTFHVNGVLEASATNTNKIQVDQGYDMGFGVFPASVATTQQTGYFDDIIIAAGYNAPVTPPGAQLVRDTVDCYDLQRGQIRSSNDGSTFTNRCRIYLGEADTNATTVTAVRAYAIGGRAFVSHGLPGGLAGLGGVNIVKTHNIGTKNITLKPYWECVSPEQGYSLGDRIFGDMVGYSTSNYGVIYCLDNRNQMSFLCGANGNLGAIGIKNTGVLTGLTLSKWGFGCEIERNY